MLEKAGYISFPLSVGTAFHDAMEQFYLSPDRVNVATLQLGDDAIPSLQDMADLEYWNNVLPAMVRAYCIYYKDDRNKWRILSVEEELDASYEGFRLRGKIDLEIDDGEGDWVVDHKTTSTLNKDVVAGWDFRFQFLFYFWLKSILSPNPNRKGYYINAVKKPELRVKKTESIQAFAQRVFEDMTQNPDKYFYRDRYQITPEMLHHFEVTVVRHKLAKLRAVLDPNTPLDLARALIQDKNTNECQIFTGAVCPYLELCRFGYEKMGFLYTKKTYKHLELINE